MSTFVNNLRPEIVSSKIQDSEMRRDLGNLERVYASGATEAVVFYSARIMEAVLKDAHGKFFGNDNFSRDRKPTLADIERELFDYNLLMQSRYYWAKGLRLLGNEVRHSLRRVTSDEADCALIFLEFIFTWIFCDFPLGQRQSTIYKGQSSLSRTAGNRLLDLAWTLDSSRLNVQKMKVIFGSQEQAYLDSFARNFTFPLLLIEMFIAQGEHESARRLVDALDTDSHRQKGALKNRFLQLKGLLLSREEKLEEALKLLEDDYLRQRSDRRSWIEDETVGILAGVYKRSWDKEQKESFLMKSHETYFWGWRRSNNTYLGINSASTALWLNKTSEAQEIAREVKKILEQRRTLIQDKTNSRYDLNYWDLVTLAEASLLVKDVKYAGELYKFAFSRHSNQSDNIEVTKNQLEKLIEHLGLTGIERKALNC